MSGDNSPIKIEPRVVPGKLSVSSRIMIYAWVLPTSAVAIPIVVCNALTRGGFHWVSGVLEVEGPAVRLVLSLRIVSAAALTLGHVVLYSDDMARHRFRNHEMVHVRQAEKWGPIFLPAYLLLSIHSWRKTGSGYWEHPWEVEARKSGGI
jgi:hypothetical protein